MGSGKTTVGKHLAKLLNYNFYDIDQVIIDTTGVEISWIFEQEGEAGFRKREHQALNQLCKLSNAVIATGGGCVTNPKNCELLQANGMVVYLQVSLDTQIARIAHTKNKRPLFAKNATKEKLNGLNQERVPFYQAVADFTIDTDNLKPPKLAELIASHYKKENLL